MDGWIHTSVRPCDCLSSVDGPRAYRGEYLLPVTDTRGTTHRTRDTDTDDLNTRDASIASALSHSLNSFIHSHDDDDGYDGRRGHGRMEGGI